MAFEYRENPEFSWSFSRQSAMNGCKRKYYYNYYGAHNGWLNNSPEVTEEQKVTYRYKNVTTLQLAFGNHVHEAIKTIIKMPSEADGLKELVKKMLHDTCVKGSCLTKWWEQPKQYPALVETLYLGGFKSPETLKQIANINKKMEKIENVFNTKTFSEIKEEKVKTVLEVDEPLSNTACGNFDLNGYKIFSKIDFLYIRDDGKYVIVDWKTYGKDPAFEKNLNNKDYKQLLLYVDYVRRNYNIPLEQIVCRLENVVTGTTFEVENIPEIEIKALEREIKSSIEEMSLYVKNTNLEDNKAVDKKFFIQAGADVEDKKCVSCSFRNLCWGTGN